MKNKYGKLKWAILVRTLVSTLLTVLVGTFVMVFLVDGIFQNKFVGFFVKILAKMDVSQARAMQLYDMIFGQNKMAILFVGFFLLFLIIFYVSLSGITKYIDQIGLAIENISEESDTPIKLAKPLAPLEDHMNSIKWKLREREMQAQENDQRKNDLLMYLAHDLKTPLTSIIAYLNILDESTMVPEEERKKYIHISLEKSVRLKELLDEFFEIARFNLQDITLDEEKVNLTMMLEQVADEFYAVLSEKNLTCQVEASEDLMVVGDPDKLGRVFDNLLRNAVNYSFPNTQIRIVLSHNEEDAVIEFINQGPEMSDRQLQMIFEKFYRMDSARSSQTGGAGLGLAIARQIVEAHDGTIEADNCPDGIRFTVWLPLDCDEEQIPKHSDKVMKKEKEEESES